MEDNKTYAWRYLLAFIIATALFIIIFLTTYSISYLNYKGIEKENTLIQKYIKDFESYLNKNSCDESIITDSTIKLDEVVSRLSILETRFGKSDSRVLEQKKIFSQLSYKHLQLVKKFIEMCNADITTFIFLYSNEEDYKKESERIGVILSTLKNKYKTKAMIYSYDSNLDSDPILKIKKKQDIKEVPIVVIDEKYSQKVKNIDDLEQHIIIKMNIINLAS